MGNWPSRQTVLGLVRLTLVWSWIAMSTLASLLTKVLTPSPGSRPCPMTASKNNSVGEPDRPGRSVSTWLTIFATVIPAVNSDPPPEWTA